ncbi:MAG: RdgB/HAM1 family non-canonical purine NTP pyrophosphatase [Pyrinomonadaceae bacterium]
MKGDRDLVIATGNPGKIHEIQQMLCSVPHRLLSLRDFPNAVEVEETGDTYEANAILKARGYAAQLCKWTLADDSGLEISALNGAPGVISARYGGTDTSFDEKIALLLHELKDSPPGLRTARFVCSMAISDQNGSIVLTEFGICPGTIALSPSGTGGFGYDPIFVPNGFELSFGELPTDVKLRISHRAMASAKIMRYLQDFMGV